MTPWHALALGIVQGLGEFLPISSSGHLIVAPWLMGWPVQSLGFDLALHLGTLVAVLYAFIGDWIRIFRSAFEGLRAGNPLRAPGGRILALLFVASIPAGIAGLLLEKWAETTFRSPALVAVDMAVMGFVLFLADRRAPESDSELRDTIDISWRDAILIGLAQCAALVPGVSRSGSTISMALFLGHKRPEAARFSFLLATPITFAAVMLKVPHLLESGGDASIWIGMITSAVVGLLSIRVLLAYVKTRTYRPFAYYRWLFALVVLAVYVARR